VATGETNQTNSKIATGVYAFDNTPSGYYVIAAAKPGFKRTVHTEYVRCGQFSFTSAIITMYEGPSNETIESGLPAPNATPATAASTSDSDEEAYRIATSPPSQEAQNPRSSTQSRDQLPAEDPGVDLGIIIAERANLRERPSPTSPVIRELQRGEIIALVSREPVGPWYDVIHVESGLEGWINGNTIRLRYTQKRKPGPVFQERATGSYENPGIQITNDSAKTLYLKVGNDDRIVISPHSSQTISKPAGTYSYYASSPGVIPAFGEHTFKIGVVYEWTFYIVTTYK
jgi:hypothetical protein